MIHDNLKIGESRAIAKYIVNTFGQSHDFLYPKNNIEKRTQIDELLYFDASQLVPTQRACIWDMFYGGKLHKEAEPAFREALKYLDSRLDNGRTFLVDDTFTLADIMIACTLSMVEASEFDIDEYPLIKRFIKLMYEQVPVHADLGKPAVEACLKYRLENEPQGESSD